MLTTDVVIIGAGPVGLFAIFECGMMKLKCHVIDTLKEVGGQCTALYPEKPIYDIPGFPIINAGELIDNLKQQAKPFNPIYHMEQNVLAIQKQEDNTWVIRTSTQTEINTKVIIIAAGVGAFGPHKPPLENLEQYEESSIHYFVHNKSIYKNKTVMIAGGGDSAVDWALSLSKITKKMYVVHRRDNFRASPDSIEKLKCLANTQDNVELVVPYQLHSINGESKLLKSVTVEDFDGNKKTIETDFLLPFFGLSMNLGPIAEWGLHLDKKHITVDPTTSATSEQGIFAIGDVATYSNKLKLILCGFSEAAQAAHKAREIVYPNETFHFEYSTTSGILNSKK